MLGILTIQNPLCVQHKALSHVKGTLGTDGLLFIETPLLFAGHSLGHISQPPLQSVTM